MEGDGITYDHIIVYDISGSTECCHVIKSDGEKIKYFDFMQNEFMDKLKVKFPGIHFNYIAWDTEAEVTQGIVPQSRGGTDPTKAFELIEKNYENKTKFIHLVTDGDIYGFQYEKIELIKEADRVDIHYLGNCNHNIEFYQKFKESLKERCNVYVNDETVTVYEEIDEGELVISEEDQLAILNHDFRTDIPCPAFNKLLATVATYGSHELYKPAIRKSLAKLISKSKGNTENLVLPDDIAMSAVKKMVQEYKKKIVKNFDAVVSYIMAKMDGSNFNSGALSGNVFLKSLDKDKAFRKQCRLKKEQDAEKKEGEEEEKEKEEDMQFEDEEEEEETEPSEAKRNELLCAISLDKIKGPYLLEGSLSDKKKILEHTVKNINQIRRFPWYIFDYLPEEKFLEAVTVMLTPYTLDNFFELNENSEPNQNLYSSLYNFSKFSFVLLHKDMELRTNDVKIMLNLNYVWACSFLFNRRPSMKQTSIGKIFEVVYVYLLLLQDYLKHKDVSPVFLEDVAFTLDTLSAEKESLCKMPQFSIYYSLNLFKRILTESKILEPKSNPLASLIIRKKLNLKNELGVDNLTLFVGCLQWLNTGKCPENLAKHNVLNEEIFQEIMKMPAPTEKLPTLKIFRMLLKNFVTFIEHNNEYMFINKLETEQEHYYNEIPLNFMKYLLLSLNHKQIKFNRNVSQKNNKNIDMKLVLAYNEDYKYNLFFDRLLYRTQIYDGANTHVCWTTLRPKSVFKDGKNWSDFCHNLNQTYDHKKRLKKYSGLHLSLHKNYLKCIEEYQKIAGVDEYFKYLVDTFPYKTFQPKIMDDLKFIVDLYGKIFTHHYKNDVKAITEVIEKGYNLQERQTMERKCKITHCSHVKRPRAEYEKDWANINERMDELMGK